MNRHFNLSARSLLLVAALWSALLVIAAAVVRVTRTVPSLATRRPITTHETLVEQHGLTVFIAVSVPLVTVGLVSVVLARRLQAGKPGAGPLAWGLASLLAVIGLLGVLPGGILVPPVGFLLLLACVQTTRLRTYPSTQTNGQPA